MKRITIKDLSKFLSLSTSTISRALLNDKNVNDETRKRVMDAAAELGYKPNLTALNLKSGQSKTIGVVVPEMITPFSAKVLEGIQNVLYPLGYRLVITQSDENPLNERKNLQLLEGFNVDGIIINLCHETYNNDLYQQIISQGTPLVFFDRIPDKSLNASKVIVDDYINSSLMVEYLIKTGRKRIAHIMGPQTIRNAVERANGYKRIMNKYHIFDENLIIKTEGMTFEYGKRAVKHWSDKDIEFDSIFAFSDTLAIGAMNFLLENNIKIPGEVAVASFSGTELSTMVYPQLTSVQQPLVKMGETAAELILEKIRDHSAPSKTVLLDAVLVYRDSTL
ncbi:LacI family transcriptional regulator [Chryseobacterium shigense]|uniref:Transcriptional regulator, LacI family n=1 Tax=Chryseobacterium shigense TaxID=297244 RepID=A0A1N7I7D4_9FLAO|nr:LacI family DNA-binding transcriptional regulator [Chryseobacterium shigense]PQA97128.1 LacI family transcriptional regulator [Chryseobacterium shigense]SIS32910.1 transcriptional regulator, LacI family [Chryseobacterium shigense]